MRKNTSIPLVILLVGIIASGGIIFSRIEKPKLITTPIVEKEIILDIQPINSTDHILGNPNAKLLIIEYSDFECPFCQQFHSTMKNIMREYGTMGKVAWVYRHYPITQLFKNSYTAAVASECVVKLDESENELIFWDYLDKLYSSTPAKLDSESLKNYAIELGIDEDNFSACLITEKNSDKIKRDMNDIEQILEFDSGFSTPYSLIFSDYGLEKRISGAMSYRELKEIIDDILANDF